MRNNKDAEDHESRDRLMSDVERVMRIFRDRLICIGGRDIRIVDRDREARAVLGGVSGTIGFFLTT